MTFDQRLPLKGNKQTSLVLDRKYFLIFVCFVEIKFSTEKEGIENWQQSDMKNDRRNIEKNDREEKWDREKKDDNQKGEVV